MSQTPLLRMDVLVSPYYYERVESAYWQGRVAVVIDVLRATSTMVTALAEGYDWILPCRGVEQARVQAARLPGTLLAGERGGLPPEGFQKGNSPREFLEEKKREGGIILTTSNGTRAMEAAQEAEILLVGSFLNLSATTAFLRKQVKPVVFVCSGTGEDFALEDALLAGAFLNQLHPEHPMASLYRSYEESLEEVCRSTCNGRCLVKLGLAQDIIWCCQKDRYEQVVARHADGFFRRM
jgi:2-phosphosulfolactate phosphatase